ncbi:YxD-tail cyclophane-containing RiPP peptide [Streptomyces rimosus]|uniref:YxD-tail cyclophane-containing RiPP peptide n=1 Tax=Streptomyces rimosus TaxID=1927 RepID=UPI0004C99D96|nr:YxD-tail cyclophane-containing RiPP peptide [Streptomyces rimosus]
MSHTYLPVQPSEERLPDLTALPLGELTSRTDHPVLSTLLPGVCERLENPDGAVAFYDDAPPVA